MHRLLAIALVFVLVAGLGGAVPAPTFAQEDARADAFRARKAPRASSQRRRPEVAPGRYIVLLGPSTKQIQAASADLARTFDLKVTHVYERVVNGFAARIPAAKLARLRHDPRVASITPDRIVRLHREGLPTGVDRIGADAELEGKKPTEPGDPVAVIDTGIAKHRDLKVAGGHNCVNEAKPNAWRDKNGHGTHVAGIIGAKRNGDGVVGVAPGTELYSVRVFGKRGGTTDSVLICALEWVVANAAATGIKVANMSLGGFDSREDPDECESTPFHDAICAVVAAGVKVVVSAGNDFQDAIDFFPAKYVQVTTVSALTDTDGCTGGVGPLTRSRPRDLDDVLAIYSNWGEVVDVAAPGTDIRSTWLDGGYEYLSGTSMAAPHVSGALARGWDGTTKELSDPNPFDDDLDPDLDRVWWDTEAIPFDPDGQNEGIVRLSDHIDCG